MQTRITTIVLVTSYCCYRMPVMLEGLCLLIMMCCSSGVQTFIC
jgi:hypothetical protein